MYMIIYDMYIYCDCEILNVSDLLMIKAITNMMGVSWECHGVCIDK